MSRSFRVICLLVFGALLSNASSASVQGVAKQQASPKAPQAESEERKHVDLESARRRWERLSPSEKERLRERYEKLRSMGEADRRDLERRRRHLERVERRLVERLDERDRARLAALQPQERERILREMVEDELHAEARRLEEKLPNDWRERLDNANPQDRRRFFKDFKRQVHQEWSPRALEKLGREFGASSKQIEAWKQLPLDEQKQKLLELGKRHRRQAVEQHGLPEGVAPEEWDRLQTLPPDRFFEEAMRLREAQGWEPGRPFFGGPPPQGDEGRRADARRLRSASRTRPEDRLEFSHLSPEERHERVDAHRRERLIGALEKSGLVPQAELDSMRGLPKHEFWKCARKLNDDLSLGLGRAAEGRRGGRAGRGQGGRRRGDGPPPLPEGEAGPPAPPRPDHRRPEGGDRGFPPPPRRGGEGERRRRPDDAGSPPSRRPDDAKGKPDGRRERDNKSRTNP
jgi:hypothetical protein